MVIFIINYTTFLRQAKQFVKVVSEIGTGSNNSGEKVRTNNSGCTEDPKGPRCNFSLGKQENSARERGSRITFMGIRSGHYRYLRVTSETA